MVDRTSCDNCGQCVTYCYQNALEIKGFDYSEDSLLKILLKYKPYYTCSGGGVTFSGGEPLLNQGFVKNMIGKLKENDIDVIIETSLSVQLDVSTELALTFCSMLYVDIKKFNSSEHEQWTGSGNELIIKNIRKLDCLGIPMFFRTPVIPGVNDSETEIALIANFVNTLTNAKGYQLIPYHPLGLPKYPQLGLEAKFLFLENMDKKTFEDLVRVANNVIQVGGKKR